MKQLQYWSLWLLIFLIPSNLFLRLSSEHMYVRGIFVDYLIPKLYLSELVAIVFIATTCYLHLPTIKKFNWAKETLFSVCSLAIIMLTQLILHFSGTTLAYLLQLFIASAVFIVLIKIPKLTQLNGTNYAVMLMVFFQSLLGIYQFTTNHELFGYMFLGEARLSQPLGVVHQQIWGSEHVLPYGTTAHPNVLAGILALGICILWLFWKHKKNKILLFSISIYVTIFTALYSLFLTQSFSALLCLLVFVILQICKITFIPKKHFLVLIVFSFIFTVLLLTKAIGYFPESDSIRRRVALNKAAVTMIEDRSLFGVGLLGFTRQLPEYYFNSEIVQFIQPVHHVPLLWLSETGMVGAIGIVIAFYFLTQRTKAFPALWLCLIPLAALDHYLITIQSGMLLAVFFIACVMQSAKNQHKISR